MVSLMPVYQYECTKCDISFEEHRSIKQKDKARCPNCNSWAKKVFSPVAIIFKGSGFYITDSRKNGGSAKKERAKASLEPSAKSESKDTSKTNSKETPKDTSKDTSKATASKSTS